MNITFKFLRPAPNNHLNAITTEVRPRYMVGMPDGTLSLILVRSDGREHALNMTPEEARQLGARLMRVAGT